MATNQVGNVVDINTLLQALNAQNHLQIISHQTRDNAVLQDECRSEDQEIAEDEETDFITGSESMLQSYCSRKGPNKQAFSGQVDSGQFLNEESPVLRNPQALIQSDCCI